MASRRTWLKRTLIGGGAVFGLLLLWSVWALFGPLGNGIPVGPETTVLDGPLDAAGYVDYPAAVREIGRVPPEENAAVAVFRVLQTDLQRQMPAGTYAAACEDLGVDPVPDRAVFIARTFDAPTPAADLKAAEAGEIDGADLQKEQEDRIERLRTRPWRTAEYPEIAAWLAGSDAGVEVLREGLSRPGWWFFPPQDGTLVEYLLPMTQESRRLSRVLSTRIMNRIGEGDLEAAAAEVDLMRRLGDRVGSGVTLIDLLVGLAIDATAADAEKQLLAAAQSPDFVRERLRTLDALDGGRFQRLAADRYDHMERFYALEQMQLIDRAKRGLSGSPPPLGGVFPGPPIVKRVMLRRMDAAEGSRLINRTLNDARESVMADVAADAAESFEQPPDPGPLSILDGDFLMRKAVQQFMPGVTHVATAVHRPKTRIQLLRVLAAGRLFELDHGRPPASPEDIVPEYLPEWPTDHHDGQPLRHADDGAWTVYGFDPRKPADAIPADLSVDFPPRPPKSE